ncbi:MAG: hypothetical protein V4677_14390 [Bacteroidota bacterium]
MSSQFSYELDERQIRIAMQDAELDYNESVWNKFDELSATQYKASANVGNFIPKINLSISRSIIVPVIFIVLIGGLSAMLFSFVDFKKKESIDKEIPYVAKVEPLKKPEIKAKTIIRPKPVETKAIITTTIANTPSVTIATNSVIVEPPVIKKEEPAKITETKPQELIASAANQKKEPIVQQKKRIKKVKATEALPTINASTNLNEGATEPELELK